MKKKGMTKVRSTTPWLCQGNDCEWSSTPGKDAHLECWNLIKFILVVNIGKLLFK